MKKTICAMLAVLTVCAAGLTACGGSDSSSSADGGSTASSAAETEKSIDVAAAADRFKNEIKWVDSLNELEPAMVAKVTGVADDLYTAGKVYIGSGGSTAEEIAVFEANDITSADAIVEAYKKRVEAQKKAFENYQPGEMEKLGNPLLTTAGKYVFVCISDDRSKAMEIMSELI